MARSQYNACACMESRGLSPEKHFCFRTFAVLQHLDYHWESWKDYCCSWGGGCCLSCSICCGQYMDSLTVAHKQAPYGCFSLGKQYRRESWNHSSLHHVPESNWAMENLGMFVPLHHMHRQDGLSNPRPNSCCKYHLARSWKKLLHMGGGVICASKLLHRI